MESKTHMKILITGTAGFIGSHLAKELLKRGFDVVGLDNINDYYDVSLKYGRLKEAGINIDELAYNKKLVSNQNSHYQFIQLNLEDDQALNSLFETEKFDYVCNLAAQAGVRYSLENPKTYVNSNIVGFVNILEACRYHQIKHFVYASSSSVYGLNECMPFCANDNVDHPISLYAASKKSNELMAHTYSHLFNLPTTGLRFFTVYGPWGRPDMAMFLFTKAIIEGKPIKVFNEGKMLRDFTYIDDIVEGVSRVIEQPAQSNPKWDAKRPEPSSSKAPFRVYNIGNNKPVELLKFIETIENKIGLKAEKQLMPMQDGDVPATYANVDKLIQDFDYKPNTDLDYGIGEFVKWYRTFYQC